MELKFYGAAGGEVTGSCYLLETKDHRFMVDCGFFQGRKETELRNWEAWDFDPAGVDFLLLTHGHLDHVGLLPKLVRGGFKGRIISTAATRDVTRIILDDAAKIQEEDEKHKRHPDNKPALYRQEDIDQVMELFEVHPIGEIIKLNGNLRFRMRNAGHILGSVSYEIWYETKIGRERKIVFSGDLGQPGARIIKDPDFIREADYVIIESTYGGRLHKDKSSTLVEFVSILQALIEDKGQGIVPTFAVERAQEILYELNLFIEKGVIKDLAVFLDSPMAIKTTRVFRQYKDLYDTDARALLKKGDDPFTFPGLEFTESVQESKDIVGKLPSLIMAGSGMCTGGRVLHHLRRELPNPHSHVIFVGFQVPGTLGRRIVDREDTVKIWGEEIPVRAQVHTLGGFSAHGDQNDLMYWLGAFGHHPRNVIITHGDQENRTALANKVNSEMRLNTHLPELRESMTLD